MDQNTMDQEWQKMQFRIDKLVGHFLKENFPAIEYRTRIAGLLQSPLKYNEQSLEEE